MIYPIIFVFVVGIIIGFILFYFLLWKRSGGRAAAQAESPKFSEKEAEAILARAGLQIMERRPKAAVITKINGQDHFGCLEADYLVKKDKKRQVVVVHYTEGEPDPNEPHLRRRLLEYDNVYAPDGLLILDINTGEIREVTFRFPRERGLDVFFRALITVFIILAAIGIIWVMFILKLI
ncbi:MAG: hypothetical protein PHH60_01715 [Candidatus Margulisbacteria bacterium]|nr:hypothetical protein [Candidatus Margulisiibacteriota bacterium]